MIRVSDIKLTIHEDKEKILRDKISKALRINSNDIITYNIFKESIDARKQDMIFFTYTVDVKLSKGQEDALREKGFKETPNLEYKYPSKGKKSLNKPPVIVGSGPAGLFCALLLSQMGYNPILIERGEDVDKRTYTVNEFWKQGSLNPESNVQFGEGGAGTFSDGKLTTLIKDKRCRKILEEMVKAGAPDAIMYSHKPHVGTDILKNVVKTIREQIIKNGGQVLFGTKLLEVITEGDKVRCIHTNQGELETETLVLALGHSARDTFEMLYDKGINIEQKAFSIGVRVEHPQRLINEAQYKGFADHPKLGAAEYKLVYHSKSGRSAYSFCMCPGGMVVAAASEPGHVVTNGMSEHARDRDNANSALLVGVTTEDFGSAHPLAGVEFQRKWEKRAFEIGGKNYNAPAQLVGDFLEGRESTKLGHVIPSYKKDITLTDLTEVLPDYVTETLKEAIVDFDKKIKGFANPHAILTGVETRSSSPIRILRNEKYQSNIEGIYPCGEGAGYAGGIISAAVDGLRVAEAIIQEYKK
ncbi:hypothetical protein HYG86_12800 [Alkalicella caledoniensis]|uniref:FAD-dependent protein C-terminal domain-containing protein n=1 Tax=Alkalicella caledoniensis TaxID=2731377 RepID=A0A7G9WA74_ALKCA|nr:NAD(P)-binding protein [Alkalicella caledoniensis]QNO15586.1 hypothetical protein HYG86_12800 [Alkalicella caledoniensis]